MTPTEPQGPLKGLAVIEMGAIGPVPLAGQLLADLGAAVTVIDRAPVPPDPALINRRGKGSAVLDLKSVEGLARAREMIGTADVLLEGFRPGVMERLGLGPEDCHALNPRLVYGRMTGWGQDGPLAQTAGHDINYIALTGALHAIGPGQGKPVPPLNLLGDYGGGTMFLLFGVLAALYERASSRRGQVVDAAIVDGVPAMMSLIHELVARGSWTQAREANWLDGGAPYYACYETADGRHLAVGALEDPFFARLAQGMGLSDDLVANRQDRSRWPEMREAYAAIFRTRSRDEWMAEFGGTDACAAPVLTFEEAARDPHMAARGAFLRQRGVLQAGVAPRFSRTPGGVRPVGRGEG
ncbi:MAG: CoA transferase [Paracoccaceae bacterium]|nr:CoA transferase [Paracoccaceae bacterium]